jgi:hypothetical protein
VHSHALIPRLFRLLTGVSSIRSGFARVSIKMAAHPAAAAATKGDSSATITASPSTIHGVGAREEKLFDRTGLRDD